MTLLLTIIIVIVLINIFCILKLKKYQKNAAGLLVLLLFILICFVSPTISDYQPYNDMYDLTEYFDYSFDPLASIWFGFSSDYGYTLINKIFLENGFTYSEFRFISSAALLSILVFIINRSVKMVSIVAVFYIIHPFFLDIPQVRNFIVEIFLFVAIYYRAKNSRFSIIQYSLIIILGAFFHKIALIYLPFIFIDFLRRRKYLKTLGKIVFIISLCMPLYASFINNNLEAITQNLMVVSSFESYAGYTQAETMRFGYIVTWMHVLLLTILLKYIVIQIGKKEDVNDFSFRYINIVYQFYLYMCFIMPIFSVSIELMRVPRNLLLPTYVSIAMYYNSISNHRKANIFFVVCLFLILGVAYVEYYLPIGETLVPILQDNYLIGNGI